MFFKDVYQTIKYIQSYGIIQEQGDKNKDVRENSENNKEWFGKRVNFIIL